MTASSALSAVPDTAPPLALPGLTIVIPALNEEGSIGSTVQRCLDARDEIRAVGRVGAVEIVVVNDGSTDRTSAIAHAVADHEPSVTVIDFPVNRGYGAALKRGFAEGIGEFVSFLDADGTCDPRYFGPMCRTLQDESAAVVLGSRMGPNSEMPRVRRIGNRMFAILLGVLSGQAVQDTASGMRVIRRNALSRLYPLPDGLQFTPAMSARAVMDGLRIVEIDMAYSERVGESKLHVLRDGVRFLVAILSALLLFRPNRLFNLAAVLFLAVAAGWILYPAEFYLRNRRLEEWMIYRVLLCNLLLTGAFVFLAGGVLADRILTLVYRRRTRWFLDAVLASLFSTRNLVVAAVVATVGAFALVMPGLVEYALTAQTALHWSRAIVAALLLQIAFVAVVSAILQAVISLWKGQLDHVSNR
jgi:glycosyltransferase involved in cell wall biosynthesis